MRMRRLWLRPLLLLRSVLQDLAARPRPSADSAQTELCYHYYLYLRLPVAAALPSSCDPSWHHPLYQSRSVQQVRERIARWRVLLARLHCHCSQPQTCQPQSLPAEREGTLLPPPLVLVLVRLPS